MVKNKGGWNTLIWYGGIIGLSSLLSKVKFFEWLAEVFKNNLAFDGHGNVAFFVIIFLSIIVRYFFASGSAYIVAMLPVFAMLANVSGAPLMLTALALLFSTPMAAWLLTMAARQVRSSLAWVTTILNPGGWSVRY